MSRKDYRRFIPNGTIDVEIVMRSSGLRPYSSASWPKIGSTTILNTPTTYKGIEEFKLKPNKISTAFDLRSFD